MAVADVIRQYGHAMRGDWSEVDGRTVRDDMEEIASWIENDSYPGDAMARQVLGVCGMGDGHWCGNWKGYCKEYKCGCPND